MVVVGFSTAPSPLYRVYELRDGFSPLTLTLIYAAYVVGVVASLYVLGHLSDMLGRKPFVLAALLLCAVAAVVFIVWPGLYGLYTARILSGLAVGLVASSAAAYIAELYAARWPAERHHRAQLLAGGANVGGIGAGAFLAALLAEYAPRPLISPYLMFLALTGVAAVLLAIVPETRARSGFRLRHYRLRKLTIPTRGRRSVIGALVGVAAALSTLGMFVGVTGTILAGSLSIVSPLATGVVLLVIFAAGVAAMSVTSTHSTGGVALSGASVSILGLLLVGVDVAERWGLAVFVTSAALVGAGCCLVFAAALRTIISTADPAELASTLALFFLVGYLGLGLPVIGVGICLLTLTITTTLIIFSILMAAGIILAVTLIARNHGELQK